jgi:hypothetical protein
LDWFQSNQYCKALGGNLASFSTLVGVDKVVTGQNINTKTSSYWIGFSNLDNKGFSWIDGSNVNFTNWDTNQPDNYNRVEECGAIVRTGKWNDVICYTGRGWLCKIPKGIVPPTTPIVVNDTFTGKKLIVF